MARKKRNDASGTRTTVATSNKASQGSSGLAEPPESLSSIIPYVSKQHVYLFHTDTFPASHKRNVFLVPLTLNLMILLALAWRASSILPVYGAYLARAITQTESGPPVSTSLAGTVLRRALGLALDYALFGWVSMWPYSFFVGAPVPSWMSIGGWLFGAGMREEHDSGSGFWFRSRQGFKFHDKEIVVRRSRRELPEDLDDKKIKEVVGDATDEVLVCARTGMALIGMDWELDYALMGRIEDVVRRESRSDRTKREEACMPFDRWVLLPQEGETWVVSETCWPRQSYSPEALQNRARIQRAREKLESMGKEGLFYRWIEAVNSMPGAGTPAGAVESQAQAAAAAVDRVKGLFAAEGVDFEQFWKDVEKENTVVQAS